MSLPNMTLQLKDTTMNLNELTNARNTLLALSMIGVNIATAMDQLNEVINDYKPTLQELYDADELIDFCEEWKRQYTPGCSADRVYLLRRLVTHWSGADTLPELGEWLAENF